MNKPLALFGAGFCGEKFYYSNDERTYVKACFDNNVMGKDFHGIPIMAPDSQNVRKYFIIITIEDYREVRDQLEGYGLKEFEDFVGWKFFHKKVAVIHGNCYRRIWDECLKSSEEFNSVYTIYDNPQIHINEEGRVREAALKQCDLLITQDIQADNAYGYFLSYEYIKQQVLESCKIVVVPNFVGLGGGFFPQVKEHRNNERRNIFPEADENIDKLFREGADWRQIQEKLRTDVYKKEDIVLNFKMYINKILQREANWDIKISDFILENYETEKIFFDTRHPTNFVLEEIIRRLLDFLGMDTAFQHAHDEISEEEVLVYPCVKKALGLKWDIENIRNNTKHRLTSGHMDMGQYIKEYIYWNYM